MSELGSWSEWEDVLGDLDPETHGDLFGAAIDRAMTLEIGLAARNHVALDQVLHATISALTGAAAAPGASTSTPITRVEKAVKKSPLPGSKTNERVIDALSAARRVNRDRNRVLHDEWVAVFDEYGPQLKRSRTDIPLDQMTPTSETLSAVTSVSAELEAVYYRVLGILLFAKLSDGLSPSEVETECATALALISGVRRTTTRVDEPEPPEF